MPQSLAKVLVHIVYSTKDRTPNLRREIRAELFPYTGGILRHIECPLLQIGGIEDHVHMLIRLPRTMTLAQVVEKTKTSTSKWLKTKGLPDFAWQAGYGAFSIGANDIDRTVRYIQSQEEHHRKMSFQDELRALMAEAGLEMDERYAWD
jgi:REP element-mobilizing transposase RayT